MHGVKIRLARMHSDGDDHGDGLARSIYRSISRLMLAISATHIVGVTQSTLSFAVGPSSFLYRLLGRKLLVVPNGVDTSKFYPHDQATSFATKVLYVGRASPEKNRALLIPIWKELDARGFPGTMSIVGSNDTDDLASEIPSTVHILGDRNDVHELLRESAVLILTSLREGLPTVVLEALASGVPVVTSDLPGLREIQASCAGVSTVRLGAPPSVWASAVVDAVDAGESHRRLLREAFLTSPYSLDESVRRWKELWSF
ncbi:glycosyltransferase family 4 protein [Arthrobacter sp. MMS24-S77]